MPCYRPVKGYRRTDGALEFKRGPMSTGQLMTTSCGRCVGCKLDHAKSWMIRCVHEDRTAYKKTGMPGSFLTLTYAPEHLPPGGSISKKTHQIFIKKFRDHLRDTGGPTIRYFMCGEYGADEYHEDPEDPTVPKVLLGPGRPHYHYLIFGFQFQDEEYWKTHRGHDYFLSPTLQKLWPYGFSTIGRLTPETVGYTTRYVLKKQIDHDDTRYERLVLETGELYPIQPEFALMSLKPGIGKEWFEKYGLTDIYDSGDYVEIDGVKYKTPRYYDKLYDDLDERELIPVQNERRRRSQIYAKDQTDRRLRDREELQKLRLKKLVRGLENGSI